MSRVLIFGGTGSLGASLVRRFLAQGSKVYVGSRDEAKHVKIKGLYPAVENFIGDIRDRDYVIRTILRAKPTHIINAAALKNVPECEDFPEQAVLTNITGTINLVQAIEYLQIKCKCLSVSTDKACKPVNSYGMTKALQERIHLKGGAPGVFSAVRYGNVLESRGSVIPFFKNRIQNGLDLPITHDRMTRFLLSLDEAVDLIERALACEESGKIFIPRVKSCLIKDLAEVMCEHYGVPTTEVVQGELRPGEKIDEILVSEEECYRTEVRNDGYTIHGFNKKVAAPMVGEYSSKDYVMNKEELKLFLVRHGVLE